MVMSRYMQLIGPALMLAGLAFGGFGAAAQTSPAPTTAPAVASEFDLDRALADRVLGKPDAPVTLVEYSSLTCPHCAAFHKDTLPKLKAEYIDTGKVKLILRDYPFDQPGARAAMLARCVPESRYFAFMDLLFANQDKWARGNWQENLVQNAKLAGVSGDLAAACMANEPLLKGILTRRIEGEKMFQIESTPTFVLNNGAAKIVGAQSYDEFKRAIDRLLPKS
jgi:protein-disulfide isomerase